ncbi:putative quinol monooxygenase [Haloarchaeobius sp. TZWWS8]|uniref:putative quinol monooxygenase n=1 Tax=Haloarchaeobius sp. TZWWS8 TaxID=3446121 RepID=UPI003EBD1C41
MQCLITTIPVDPAHRDEFDDLAAALVRRSRAMEGTLDYHAMADVTDPNTVRVFERYADQTALDEHVQTDEYRAFVERLPGLVDGDLSIVHLEGGEVLVEKSFAAAEAIPDEW